MTRFKIKRYSYLKYSAMGALGGTLAGGATGYITGKKGERKSRALKGATIGATSGALLGSGLKYGKQRYRAYIGTPKKADLSIVRKNGQAGDIIVADRGSYQHYGILDKNGNVIEYGSHKFDPRTARVGRVSLDEFSNGSAVRIETPKGPFSRDEIVKRAESQIGVTRGQYNLRNNNCEHFAREMASGEKYSGQASKVNDWINENIDKKVDSAVNYITGHTPVDKISQTINNTANNVVKYIGQPSQNIMQGSTSNRPRVRRVNRRTRNKVSNNQKNYSYVPASGDRILAQQFRHFVGNDLYNVRSKLAKELGGLNHFNRHQSHYLSGGGAVVGSAVGRYTEGKRAKRDAVRKYGLKKGTLEYDNYVNSRKNKGTLVGAGIGAGAGFGLSKGTDLVRGKVITDKARVKYGDKLNLGKNYMSTGKSMRGIRSEGDIDTIVKNWKETGDYVNSLKKMV